MKLYTISNKKLRSWECFSENGEVVVIHGEVGGKMQEKRYLAEPKNVGKANETTSEAQAELEALAKIVKQLKSGYFETIEAAKAFSPFAPMKAQSFDKHSGKLRYPCYYQPKLDGQRLMIDKDGNAWSKQGEKLELPEHWIGVKELAIRVGGLDGEVYAGLKKDGGLSLQEIISAFRKPNENTKALKFYVYDIPVEGLTMTQRVEIMNSLSSTPLASVVVVPTVEIFTEADGTALFTQHRTLGYEGSVARQAVGLYEFDKRSYGLLKRKERQDGEALVLSFTLDKNDEPVYVVRAVNGEQAGVEFKLKMKIPDGVVIQGRNYRNKENAQYLLGKYITYEFEDLSDENVPLKPVGLCTREMRNGEGRW